MGAQEKNDKREQKEFNFLILSKYPYPIAVNYQRLLEADSWESRTRLGIELFEYGLRTVTLSLLSQYLIHDVYEVNDQELNSLLSKKFSKASLGLWVEFLFRTLKAYQGERDRLFTPELYDLYWDTSHTPHREREGVRGSFQRLVEIRNDLAHRPAPADEAGWQALGEEVLAHLQTILEQFDFIRDYDLIRVVAARGEGEYAYQEYIGQAISTQHGSLRVKGTEEITPGLFYLLRGDRYVFRLHPLVVLWTEEGWPDGGHLRADDTPQDVALFERLMGEAVEYVTLVVREVMQEHDIALLAQLRALMSHNLEKLKMGRRAQVTLTWDGLREAGRELSAQRMGAVREKYDRSLYLQRDETFAAFQAFLASAKTCFVLTGKSGVGKSNFVLSLMDEFAGRDDLCYLLYDAARLEVPDTVPAAVGADLGKRLGLGEEAADDLFAHLEKEEVLWGGRQLLLVFDAINENADGKAVLRKIDRMVGEVAVPWLKVLITSRPQAWRTLKRGLRLAEHRYYQGGDGDDLAVEMDEFAVKLDPFARSEVAQAYAKYRAAYNLQTPFAQLPVPVREALRDPLVLRLVADIYHDRALPEHIQVGDIYRDYEDRLVETGRLRRKDIRFLEQELMPLMLAEDHVDNKLTDAQLNAATTADGRPLWELIHNEDRLSSGERVNASYARLADAEILMEQGTNISSEIGFKYERFYDYHGGRRLRELVVGQTTAERRARYEEWIAATQAHPFLWGAVQTALRLELAADDRDALIIALCQTDTQVVKDMMVAVLSAYGEEAPQKTGALLGTLIQMGEDDLTLRQRFLPFGDVPFSQRMVNARKTAVDVAANVGSVPILERGVLDRSAVVRNHAVLQTMNLWQRDKEALEAARDGDGADEAAARAALEAASSVTENRGFAVVRRLNDHIRPGLVPNIQAAQSAVSMMLFLALTHYNAFRAGRERALGEELQRLARAGLDRLLYIGRREGMAFWAGNVVRNQVISALVAWANRVFEDTPEKTTFNATNIGTFLRRPRAEKEVMRTITRCMDSANTDIAPLEEAIPQIIELNEGSTDYALQFALIAQWENNRGRVTGILETLFEEGMERPRPDYTVYVPVNVLHAMLSQGRAEAQMEAVYVDWWRRLTRKARGRVFFSGNEALRFQVGPYFEMKYALHNRVDTTLPKEFVLTAVEDNDAIWMKAIINELSDAARRKEFIHPSLEALKPLLLCQNSEIQQRVINMLARLRRLYEYQIDDFMVENELSNEFQTRVKTTEVKGAVGGVALYGPVSRFIPDAISYSPKLQQVAIWILNRTIETDDFNEFIELLIKRVINLAYGDVIFDLPKQ